MMPVDRGDNGISVLMAVYNGAAYLREQIDSIIAQVSIDDEIIIIDDCSTDDSFAIICEYAERHPFIAAKQNDTNLGVRGTYERLLGLAGKAVIFLSDQDDIWIEGRRATMAALLEREGCTAVLANALIFTEEGVQKSFFPEAPDPDVASVWGNFVRNNFIGCCMAFRREVCAIALPFPTSISMHDWWLGSCAMSLGEVCYSAAPSLLYRRHSNNQSASKRRAWRVVLKDRGGNLLALASLLHRRMRYPRST